MKQPPSVEIEASLDPKNPTKIVITLTANDMYGEMLLEKMQNNEAVIRYDKAPEEELEKNSEALMKAAIGGGKNESKLN